MLHHDEMSVLERQRVMLERLYSESKHQLSSLPLQNLAQFNNLVAPGQYHNMIGMMNDSFAVNFSGSGFNSSCQFPTLSDSTITTVSKEKDRCQVLAPDENVATTKKRKAEFYEEEECKTMGIEVKAGEVLSEITEKSQRGTLGNNCKENSKNSEVEKPEYIHVRARRGQATDSHSLAERARREKISKKMKCLQDLVPGCNKITGKAGMLDEIINYVQSLQKQVEFLSMKLAAMNPQIHSNTDNFFANYVANFPVQEYSLIQHQQRSGNCLMSFQESSLAPSTVVQQQQVFETDLQSIFQCQL